MAGISAELGNGEQDHIEIMLGTKPDRHVTHTIVTPTKVSLAQTDQGARQTLAIEDADKATTLLRFRSGDAG